MQPVVRQWFQTHTYRGDSWSAAELRERKGTTSVSVVLPARDEEPTVGRLVAALREELVDGWTLVDEVVVMDSRSTDRTAQVAARAGAQVFAVDDVLPELGRRGGKGEAMWKSLAVTSGELVVFLDADLRQSPVPLVTGLLGPLLSRPEVELVKAAYDRVLDLPGERSATGGGRVTELAARPLLNAHWPLLAGILQPLAGEYAARRTTLEQVPFACGYGVEMALLIDVLELRGLPALAQVDLGRRLHRNRPDTDLVATAAAVVLAATSRLPQAPPASRTVTRFSRAGEGFLPVVLDVPGEERPPFAQLRGTRVA